MELDMAPAVNFLFSKVATHPALLAAEFILPKPLASLEATLVPFTNEICNSNGHFKTALLLNNVK